MSDTEQDNKCITQENFEHAQIVCDINILRRFHDIYILLDVLLGVFEEFHTMCNKNYELGLAYYYLTAPTFSFHTCFTTLICLFFKIDDKQRDL